jgi:hypothetical protein
MLTSVSTGADGRSFTGKYTGQNYSDPTANHSLIFLII